jgi:hypothetical protein
MEVESESILPNEEASKISALGEELMEAFDELGG